MTTSNVEESADSEEETLASDASLATAGAATAIVGARVAAADASVAAADASVAVAGASLGAAAAKELPPPPLRLTADGELELGLISPTKVTVTRCFPWSHPTSFFSLRNEKNEELLLVENLSDLDLLSRDALERALKDLAFVHEIVSVESIEEEYELRVWRVQTKQGNRVFQNKLDDWPFQLPGSTRSMIKDISNDLYLLPVKGESDAATEKLLAPYLD